MEEKLVSDEAYKKGQKLIKKIRMILLIVGLVLLVGGATLMIIGSTETNGYVSSEFVIPGSIMVFFAVVALLNALGMTFVAHQREILAYQASATLPVAGEVGEKVIDFTDKNSSKIGSTVGNVVGGVVREAKKGLNENKAAKPVVCPKCQYKNDATDKFCGGCGEKLEQTNHCTNCGAEVKATDKFCSSCGTKVK